MKIKKILLVFILVFFTFINISYAANEAVITLTPDSNSLNKNDKFYVSITANNTGVQDGIYSVMGELEFDNTILEIVTLNIDELTSEQQDLLKQYETIMGMLDILYFDDTCLIGGLASDESYLITVIYINEEDSVEYGKTETMGKIEFKVLGTAPTGSSTIKLTQSIINENAGAPDTSTTITILGTQDTEEEPEEQPEEEPEVIIDTEEQPEEDEDIDWEEPQLDDKEDEKDEQAQEDPENEIEEEQEKDGDIPGLGAEDYIPFISILVIVAIVSFSKYRKYRGI